MSSPYVTLGNRPLEQWKVVELKEELKKRKLATKGLKEDLLKRLDEAVRIEQANYTSTEDHDDAIQSEEPIEQIKMESASCGKDNDPISIGVTESDNDCQQRTLSDDNIIEADVVKGTKATRIKEHPVETTPMTGETVEVMTTLSGSNLCTDGNDQGEDSTAVLNNDELPPFLEDAKLVMPSPNDRNPLINKSMDMTSTDPDIHGSKTQNEGIHLTGQMEIDDSKHLQSNSSFQPLKCQVSEVNPNLGLQVMPDSISIESVSVIEKNELEVDVITDNIQLELDVKHEKGQTPASSDAAYGGEFHPAGTAEPPVERDNNNPLAKNDVEHQAYEKDDKESHDKKDAEQLVGMEASKEMTSGTNVDSADGLKNIDSVDLGPEKLSLDPSSGDDAMEDILDIKQTEYKSDTYKSSDNVVKAEIPITSEDDHVDVVGHDDKPVEMKVSSTENETLFGQAHVKRKFHDNEAAGHNDTMKKARRWSTENQKGSEKQSNLAATTSLKGLSEPSLKSTGTYPGVYEGTPKERIVRPSSKPPTNSLRIDRFLRPFTLKAVQELLGKTGTVTSFWMDHIKTHCYVSYSSIEEAVETRNAVDNIQWPPNGGRFLVAEFVDPQEVKTRVEAPPTGSASTNLSTSKTQSLVPPQTSPRQQLPPLPLSSPSVVKERELLPSEQAIRARDWLNPPPLAPRPEKMDPPIVTLDDLFRKTRATPHIYYLALSDEEVAAKVKSRGKNVNQCAGVACRMFRLRWCCSRDGSMDCVKC